MTKLRKLFGFHVTVDEVARLVDGSRLFSTEAEWNDFRKQLTSFDPSEHRIHLHSINVSRVAKVHFGLVGGLQTRLASLDVSLSINQRQRTTFIDQGRRRMEFLNYVVDHPLLGPDAKLVNIDYEPFMIAVSIPAAFFDARSSFRLYVFTYVSRRVPERLRKLTALVRPIPTSEFAERLKREFGDPTRITTTLRRSVILEAIPAPAGGTATDVCAPELLEGGSSGSEHHTRGNIHSHKALSNGAPKLHVKEDETENLLVLHLSDLHFGSEADATLWYSQLAEDLSKGLKVVRLNLIIVSGDIANFATDAEFNAAEQFLAKVCNEFKVPPRCLILVPGNHDVDWEASKAAYFIKPKNEHTAPPAPGSSYMEGVETLTRDDRHYPQRFAHFSRFFEKVIGSPYPLAYEQQGTIHHYRDKNLLFLGLNSAWQIDHHYEQRSAINPIALATALDRIREMNLPADCTKIAIWHHPLNGPDSARISDLGFMQRLAQAGFTLGLHGHVHHAKAEQYRHEQAVGRQRLDIIGAGTFGAPVHQWVPGWPLQYNLLKLGRRGLTVETRCRREINGAWHPDAIWESAVGSDPSPRYFIDFTPATE